MLRETNRLSGFTDDKQTVIIFEFTKFARVEAMRRLIAEVTEAGSSRQ